MVDAVGTNSPQLNLPHRHPELVSGSIVVHAHRFRAQPKRAVSLFLPITGPSAKWTLKQVQDESIYLKFYD
jgi:hypothetical protein